MPRPLRAILASIAAITVLTAIAPGARAAPSFSFLGTLAASPSLAVGTSPAAGPGAGDQNPYGVAKVPWGFPTNGPLQPGDLLVSNFNDAANAQGTGTTVVAVTPAGHVSTFFTAPPSLAPVGLTTALVALRAGLVVVGSTPTTDGTFATISNGGLIFIDQHGHVVLRLTSSTLLRGPWDMTADDADPGRPILYVSNVLSGTITRVDLHVVRGPDGTVPVVDGLTQVASGFLHRSDPAALVVGPTGLLLGGPDTLYVADTGSDRIQVVSGVRDTDDDLGSGRTVVAGAPLQGPLALARTPFGTIVASNGDAVSAGVQPNLVVEIDPSSRRFVATRQLDAGGPGGIFGIAIARAAGRPSLAYADDNTVTLDVLHR